MSTPMVTIDAEEKSENPDESVLFVCYIISTPST